MIASISIPGPSTPGDIVSEAMGQPLFAGKAALNRFAHAVAANLDQCVAIPLRNEEHYIGATCDAVVQAIRRTRRRTAVVIVCNDTTDGSYAVAQRVLDEAAVPYLIVDVAFDRSIGDAPHCRRLALDIAAKLAADGYLMTTDADTIVDTNWLVENERSLATGAGLVCGTVSLGRDALDALPPAVLACGAVESDYKLMMIALWEAWTGHAAPTLFHNAMGASLAIAARNYRAVGGLPTPPVAEDKALAGRCARHGLSVVDNPRVEVVTSGRTDARAAGGMGDALRERSQVSDPTCDEALMPVDLLRAAASAWNDVSTGNDTQQSFAMFKHASPLFDDAKMRLSEVEGELAKARTLLIDMAGTDNALVAAAT